MITIPWWLFALALVVAFWAIGAYNRLHGLRRAALAAFVPLSAALSARRAAVLDGLAAGGSSVLSAGDASDPPTEAMVHRTRLTDALRHAASQAAAAQAAAALRPLAPGRMGGLSIAEEVFEQTMKAASGPVEAGPHGGIRSRSLAQAELELAIARQAFNQAAEAHNQALGQPPASLLAAALGFRALAPMSAGPSLAAAPAMVDPSASTQPAQAA